MNFKWHKLTTAGFRLYRLSKICCGYDCLCLIFGFGEIITFEFQKHVYSHKLTFLPFIYWIGLTSSLGNENVYRTAGLYEPVSYQLNTRVGWNKAPIGSIELFVDGSGKRAEWDDGIFLSFDSSLNRRRLIEKGGFVNIVHRVIISGQGIGDRSDKRGK